MFCTLTEILTVNLARNLRCLPNCTFQIMMIRTLSMLCTSDITVSLRVGWKWVFSLMPYGEVWRERRRAFTQYFHPGNADLYRTTQEEFLRKLLPRLLKDPENFLFITRQYVSQLPVKFELK